MPKCDFTIFHEIYEYFKKVEYNLSDSEAHEAVLADEYHRLHFEKIFADLPDTPENWAWHKILKYYYNQDMIDLNNNESASSDIDSIYDIEDLKLEILPLLETPLLTNNPPLPQWSP
ncbi:MAG: hypothetical protein GY830_11250 [Bacteroidetes bacterium]|nr:hypothetical protein [Bacteroidota bacterium]